MQSGLPAAPPCCTAAGLAALVPQLSPGLPRPGCRTFLTTTGLHLPAIIHRHGLPRAQPQVQRPTQSDCCRLAAAPRCGSAPHFGVQSWCALQALCCLPRLPRFAPTHLLPSLCALCSRLQLQPRLAVPGHRGGAAGAGRGECGDGGEPGAARAALLVSFCFWWCLVTRVVSGGQGAAWGRHEALHKTIKQ